MGGLHFLIAVDVLNKEGEGFWNPTPRLIWGEKREVALFSGKL
jgi:hypothetical protein